MALNKDLSLRWGDLYGDLSLCTRLIFAGNSKLLSWIKVLWINNLVNISLNNYLLYKVLVDYKLFLWLKKNYDLYISYFIKLFIELIETSQKQFMPIS